MFFHWSWALLYTEIWRIFCTCLGRCLGRSSLRRRSGMLWGILFYHGRRWLAAGCWPVGLWGTLLVDLGVYFWTMDHDGAIMALGTSRNDNNKLAMRMTTSANKHFRYFGPDRGFDDECLKADVCWAVTKNSCKKQQINNFQQISTNSSKTN